MSAARHTRTVVFAGAVLLCGAHPGLASDRGTDRPLPRIDFTLASNIPLVPSVANATPAPLMDDVQTRTTGITMPDKTGVFSGSSLRRSMYVSFAALQVMDAVSTRKALSNGAREANPAMAGIAGNSAAMFAVKAGSAAATAYFAERLAKNHPRRAAILMVVLNTAYAAVVAHNYQVARGR